VPVAEVAQTKPVAWVPWMIIMQAEHRLAAGEDEMVIRSVAI